MKAAPLLIGSVAGSLVAAWAVLHSLHPEDRVSVVQGVCLMALGFIFFVSSFDLCNYVMFHTSKGKKFVKKYKLSLYDVMDISNKIVSGIQALLSSFSGAVVCTFSCPKNMLRTSHFMSQAYAWFGASYFLYDVYSMFVIHNLSPKTVARLKALCNLTKDSSSHEENQPSQLSKVRDFIFNQPVIIIHHLFIGLFGFLVVVHLRKNFGDCVFGLIFLMELSTPFVSFRGILSRLQLKQSRIYVINGMVMISVFFVCRILLFIILFQYYSQFVELSLFEAIVTLPTVCQISLLVLILPQIYWFCLMGKGALSIFSESLKGSEMIDKSRKENIEPNETNLEKHFAGVNGEQNANNKNCKNHKNLS